MKPSAYGTEGSIRRAGAPWAALGYVGERLQDLGEGGMRLLVEAKRADTRRRGNEMELELARAQAAYENEMLNNPDPTTWTNGWQGNVDALRKQYLRDDLAPEEKDVIGGRFTEWEARSSIGVARNAAVAIFEKDKLSAANLIEEGERIGGEVGEEMRQRGLASLEERVGPEEADKVRRASNQRFDRTRLEHTIQNFPHEVDAAVKDGTLLEKFPGLSQDDVNWAGDQARTRLRVNDGDVLDEYANLAAGDNPTLRTPDDVKRKYEGKVEPRLLEKMTNDMLERNNAATKAERNTPEFQKGVIGEVTKALSSYTLPPDGSHDYKLDDLTVEAYKLPEGPLRTNLLEQIRDKRAGLETKVKTKEEAAQKALDTHYKSLGEALPKATKFEVREKVKDGILRDVKKLRDGAGFSEGQAKDIAAAAAKDPAKAQKLVVDYWKLRPEGSVNLEPFDARLIDAIRLENPYMEWDDPETEDARIEAERQHDLKLGNAKMQLSEWLEQNPDAAKEDIEKKVVEIAGFEVEDDFKRALETAEEDDGTVPAIDPSTSQNLGLPADATDLVGMVKHFESFKPVAYNFGAWSIGYGTAAKPGQTITEPEAEKAMMKQLEVARGIVKKEAEKIGMEFTQNEEDALTSFTYNMKPGNLQKLLAGGTRTKQQIAQMLLSYRNADGKRYPGLERRRKAEQAMFLAKNDTSRNTGEFADYNVITD